MSLFSDTLASSRWLLMEGAILERLRRSGQRIDSVVAHAPLIYSEEGRAAFSAIYESYFAVAGDRPFIMCTPTWRCSVARVQQSGCPECINRDAVAFMQQLRAGRPNMFIGGLMGCCNDCYRPAEALSELDAYDFHRWQVDELVAGGVDFLNGQTLPELGESIGMARAMAESGVPYIISYVVDRHGDLLDGHSLNQAIEILDRQDFQAPIGYMVSCSYPDFICPEKQSPQLFERLIGMLANASALDHSELDNADEVKAEPIEEWCASMKSLRDDYGMKILGGCCGTDEHHLAGLL